MTNKFRNFRLGRLSCALLLVLAGCAGPSEEVSPPRLPQVPPAPEPGVLRGEVVEMGCYLRQGAKGPAHRACAQAWIKRGMPAGLLTETGELLLLMPDASAEGLDFSALAAETCEVQGSLVRRGVVRGVLVKRIARYTPPPPPPDPKAKPGS